MKRVLVIGGVAAGMSAAAKLKRTLKDRVAVTVFERGSVVSYGACGIPYYVSGVVADRSALIERTPREFAEQGVDVRLRHEAVAVDPAAKRVTVRDLDAGTTADHAYDALVVAVGARPRRFAPFDAERANVGVVRDLDDAERLRAACLDPGVRRVAVVGAGYIGLEIAEACVAHGKEVVLLEAADRVLPALDPELSALLAAELARHGVVVRAGTRAVERVDDPGGARIAALVVEDAAGRRERLDTDWVVLCAGLVPNTEIVDADKTDNGALRVDDRMATNLPDVYAAGDCSVMRSFITGDYLYAPLGTNANKQGKIIAAVLAGQPPPPFRLLGCAAVKCFDLAAAKIGLSEGDARRLGLAVKTNTITAPAYAAYYRPGNVTINLVYDARSRRLLGAQAVGAGPVAARANHFAVAMAAGLAVDDLAYQDLAYTPPFGGVWDPVLLAAHTAR